MAKGIEDTLFYSDNRLSVLNEVGGDPRSFGEDVKSFHKHNLRIQTTWPQTLLATSTRDTKRSEDVRSRLYLLSEIPAQWSAALHRLSALSERHRSGPSRATCSSPRADTVAPPGECSSNQTRL